MGGSCTPALHAGRDAPVAAALVLQLLARTGKRVGELVAAAPRYTLVKAKAARGPALEPVYAALRRRFADAQADVQDGLRLAWRHRWLHVGRSNTEPITAPTAAAPGAPRRRELVQRARGLSRPPPAL